jgi:hypothetical protein
MIVAWAKDTSFQHDGSLARRVLDPSGKFRNESGRFEGGISTSSLATVVAQPDSVFTIVHWPVPLRDESQREGLADQGDASPSGRAA